MRTERDRQGLAEQIDEGRLGAVRVEPPQREVDGTLHRRTAGYEDAIVRRQLQRQCTLGTGKLDAHGAGYTETRVDAPIRRIAAEQESIASLGWTVLGKHKAAVWSDGDRGGDGEVRRERRPHDAAAAERRVELTTLGIAEEDEITTAPPVGDADDDDPSVRGNCDCIGGVRPTQVGRHDAAVPEPSVWRPIGVVAGEHEVELRPSRIRRPREDELAVRLHGDGVGGVRPAEIADEHPPRVEAGIDRRRHCLHVTAQADEHQEQCTERKDAGGSGVASRQQHAGSCGWLLWREPSGDRR